MGAPCPAPLYEHRSQTHRYDRVSPASMTRAPSSRRYSRANRFGEGNGGYLAFLGRVSPEKGLDRAIAIARHVGLPRQTHSPAPRTARSRREALLEAPPDRDPIELFGQRHRGYRRSLTRSPASPGTALFLAGTARRDRRNRQGTSGSLTWPSSRTRDVSSAPRPTRWQIRLGLAKFRVATPVAALNWIDTRGDPDRDGFVEYHRRSVSADRGYGERNSGPARRGAVRPILRHGGRHPAIRDAGRRILCAHRRPRRDSRAMAEWPGPGRRRSLNRGARSERFGRSGGPRNADLVFTSGNSRLCA